MTPDLPKLDLVVEKLKEVLPPKELPPTTSTPSTPETNETENNPQSPAKTG